MKRKCVVSIVKKGFREKMMAAIKPLGLEGVTVIPARGTISPAMFESLSGLHYDPAREVIIHVVEASLAKEVLKRFNDVANLAQANTGIAFILDLEDFSGLYDVLKEGETHV